MSPGKTQATRQGASNDGPVKSVPVDSEDKNILDELFADDDDDQTDGATQAEDLKASRGNVGGSVGGSVKGEDQDEENTSDESDDEDTDDGNTDEPDQSTDEHQTEHEDEQEDEQEQSDGDDESPEDEESSKTVTDTADTEEQSEPGEFSIAFEDGRYVNFDTAEERDEFLESVPNLSKWHQKLHQRGNELNKREAALQNERREWEKRIAEYQEWQQKQADSLPPEPVEPNYDLNDPNNDLYDPKAFSEQLKQFNKQQREYNKALLAREVSKVKGDGKPKATPPPTVEQLDAAEKEWLTSQKIADDKRDSILDVATPMYQERIEFLKKRGGVFLVDDLTEILNKAKSQVLGKKAKAKDSVQDSRAVKSLRVASKRAQSAPKKTPKAQPDSGNVDPWSDDVSPSEFEKLLREGKV